MTNEEIIRFYELNKDRIGGTLLNLFGYEVKDSILLRCTKKYYRYWANDRIVDCDVITGEESSMHMSRDELNLLTSSDEQGFTLNEAAEVFIKMINGHDPKRDAVNCETPNEYRDRMRDVRGASAWLERFIETA